MKELLTMKRWLRRSLKNQLIVLILIVVLIPIGLLGFFSYYTTVHVSQERAAITGKGSMKQLNDSLDFIINDVESMSVFLIGNQSVQKYLRTKGEPVKQRRDIYGFLSNLAFSKQYIENILIIPLNGNSNISTTRTMENMEHDFEKKQTDNKWWSFQKENKTLDGPKEMITLTRPIRSTDDFRLIGYLSISLNQRVIESYLNSTDLEWSVSVFILNNGNVLAENKEGAAEKFDLNHLSEVLQKHKDTTRFNYEMSDQKMTVFQSDIEKVGWDLVGIIPLQEYKSQNTYFLKLTIYAVVVAFLLVMGLLIFFISKIFRPLTLLKQTIQQSNPGDRIETIETDSNNEIGELIESYNSLNHRIASLMSEVKKSESKKRELNMLALQSQINPHFLYNTLASVHWIALSSKAYDISKVVSALSDYLRFSLNKGDEYCTVEQEVNHLIRYTEIQQVRFRDMFRIQVSITKEIQKHTILKLVLQPLVENSLIHGLFPLQNHDGVIEVSATKQNKFIHFTIKDNGIGITRKKLEDIKWQFIMDRNADGVIGQHYGIRNVNLRLLMHYGEVSGLKITSQEGKGTTVRFSIPVREGD